MMYRPEFFKAHGMNFTDAWVNMNLCDLAPRNSTKVERKKRPRVWGRNYNYDEEFDVM